MRRRPQTGRRGAVLHEAAIVLLVFLTLILGMADLGIGVLRYHIVCNAARQGARQAIVHGALASQLGPWGPAPYGPVAATDSGPISQAIAPYLPGLDLSQATVQAQWIDGSNDPTAPTRANGDNRVQVTVTYPYKPIITYIFGNTTYTLSATSTMQIAH